MSIPTRQQRDKIGACTGEFLHACMPNLVSLPATHHSCVGIRCDICKKNRSEPCPCIPIIEVACPLLLAPSHAKLATAKLAGRSRRARPGQGRRRGTRQNEETLPCACLHALHEQWLCLVCSVLVNSNSLTTNYSAKQSQFTKLTSEPHTSDSEESNETFDRVIRGRLL